MTKQMIKQTEKVGKEIYDKMKKMPDLHTEYKISSHLSDQSGNQFGQMERSGSFSIPFLLLLSILLLLFLVGIGSGLCKICEGIGKMGKKKRKGC
jgi:hypothetical protein